MNNCNNNNNNIERNDLLLELDENITPSITEYVYYEKNIKNSTRIS